MLEELTDYLDERVSFYDSIVMKDVGDVYRHINGYTDSQKTIRVNDSELYNNFRQ